MKFYKVTFWSETDSSQGFAYFTNKREAEAAKKDYDDPARLQTATIEVINIKPTKVAILQALRDHGSHPDNG